MTTNNHCSCCEVGKAGKRRRLEEEDDTSSRDRLSRPPDFIIHHILSFLDTKSAVQTSVLSWVWRCAWKHVSVFDLRSASFRRYSRFERYVDKVLSLRYSVNLRKLSYLSERDGAVCRGQFVRVIEYAMRHATQHLAIKLKHGLHSFDYYESPNLFSSTLNCNLRTLELDGVAIDVAFLSFGFHALTTLKLDGCLLFFNREEDLDPFSNLPCLHNLALKNSFNRLKNMRGGCLKVLGFQLLSMVLESTGFCKIEVVAPNLRSFHFREDEDADMSLESLVLSVPSLDHADMLVYPLVNEDENELEKQRLVSLFRGLHNLRF